MCRADLAQSAGRWRAMIRIRGSKGAVAAPLLSFPGLRSELGASVSGRRGGRSSGIMTAAWSCRAQVCNRKELCKQLLLLAGCGDQRTRKAAGEKQRSFRETQGGGSRARHFKRGKSPQRAARPAWRLFDPRSSVEKHCPSASTAIALEAMRNRVKKPERLGACGINTVTTPKETRCDSQSLGTRGTLGNAVCCVGYSGNPALRIPSASRSASTGRKSLSN
jgi:hypothetical protein